VGQIVGDPGAGTLEALSASIQGLPWAAHWVAIAAVLAGLLLWGVGRQVLKPLFCLIGGIGGGIAGFFAASVLGIDQVGTVPTPFVGLGIGGVLGMAVAASLYGFSVAVGFGVVAGLSGILVSATVLELQGEAKTALDAALASHRERLDHYDSERASIRAQSTSAASVAHAQGTAQETGLVTRQARVLASGLVHEFAARWGTLEPRSQFIVALSGLGGAALGFLVGLLLPSRSAAAATALLGSAVWLVGGLWLAGAVDLPGREFLDQGPREWLIIWLSIAGVGLALQLHGIGARKKAEA
jgi:hypothetical protein